MCDPRPETQGGPKAPPLLGGVCEEARAAPGPPALGSSRLSPTSAPQQKPTPPRSPRPSWAPAGPSAQYVLGVPILARWTCSTHRRGS